MSCVCADFFSEHWGSNLLYALCFACARELSKNEMMRILLFFYCFLFRSSDSIKFALIWFRYFFLRFVCCWFFSLLFDSLSSLSFSPLSSVVLMLFDTLRLWHHQLSPFCGLCLIETILFPFVQLAFSLSLFHSPSFEREERSRINKQSTKEEAE